MARNRVIGVKGAIPWHLPQELRRFRELTMGHHLIMGRKTFESIGRLLPGRTTVIVTRDAGYRIAGAIVANSLEEGPVAACSGDEEVFVIGGSEIYAQALPLARRLYLTVVDADVPGDAHMPEFDLRDWREVSLALLPADAQHRYPFRCLVYERVVNEYRRHW